MDHRATSDEPSSKTLSLEEIYTNKLFKKKKGGKKRLVWNAHKNEVQIWNSQSRIDLKKNTNILQKKWTEIHKSWSQANQISSVCKTQQET